MKYTVVWNTKALNDLADIWTNATDRAAVTKSSNQLDASLKRDPYSDSESRDGDSRIMISPPLAIAYDVSDDDCMVTVWAVWTWK